LQSARRLVALSTFHRKNNFENEFLARHPDNGFENVESILMVFSPARWCLATKVLAQIKI